MTSPIVRASRLAMSLLLAILPVLLRPGAEAWADPVPTQIQAAVEANMTGQVNATGVLSDAAGQGVGNGQLMVSVGGQAVHTANTGADGAFSMQFNLPADKIVGPQDLVISYAGDGAHGASSHTSRIEFPAQGSTAVTLEIGSTNVNPGDVVNVSGNVKTATGGAVAGATVTFAFEGTQLPESTVVTDAGGNFSTHAEIPGTAAIGSGKLVATFAGGGNLSAGSAEHVFTVDEPAAERSPTFTPAETPTGASAPAAASSMTASPTATPSSTATATEGGRKDFPVIWFLAGAVVFLAAGALTLLGLVVRARRREADEGTLGLIGDASEDSQEFEVNLEEPRPAEAGPTEMFTPGPTEVITPRRAPDPVQEPQAMPPAWFREGPESAPVAQRAHRAASESTPGEDWDDFTEAEITQVRPRHSPRPRRGM